METDHWQVTGLLSSECVAIIRSSTICSSLTTMTDNSTDPSTDKLVPQAIPITTDITPPPVATGTPPVVTQAPAVVDATPDTTVRIVTPNVTPPAQEAPRRDTVVDPRVVALRAMFPDYDDIILCVRSTRCPLINPLLIHIAIPGYLCLILWAGIRIAPLMPYFLWVIQNTRVNHPLQCNQHNRLSCVLSAP